MTPIKTANYLYESLPQNPCHPELYAAGGVQYVPRINTAVMSLSKQLLVLARSTLHAGVVKFRHDVISRPRE
jgi:hypothetical protein